MITIDKNIVPKVSIIVPIYNVEKYINRCIKSILSQTIKEIEVILVNDGSTDNSGNIAEEFARMDNRIQVIHKVNGGLSTARNAGLEIATGEYLLFVDSDDWLDNDSIETIYNNAIEFNADIVAFDYRRVFEDEKNKIQEKCLNLREELIDFKQITLEDYVLEYLLKNGHGHEVWNKLYKRTMINNNNINFVNNKEVFAEDFLFNLCVLCHVKKIKVIHNSFYNYLQRPESLMNSKKPFIIQRYAKLYDHFITHVKKNNRIEDFGESLGIIYYCLLRWGLLISLKQNEKFSQISNQLKYFVNLGSNKEQIYNIKDKNVGKFGNFYCRLLIRERFSTIIRLEFANYYISTRIKSSKKKVKKCR